jgi:5-methylcytosine-specific restriction endonuclease McrA
MHSIDENGLLELHVGHVVSQDSNMHSIWIEPDHVLLRAKT